MVILLQFDWLQVEASWEWMSGQEIPNPPWWLCESLRHIANTPILMSLSCHCRVQLRCSRGERQIQRDMHFPSNKRWRSLRAENVTEKRTVMHLNLVIYWTHGGREKQAVIPGAETDGPFRCYSTHNHTRLHLSHTKACLNVWTLAKCIWILDQISNYREYI